MIDADVDRMEEDRCVPDENSDPNVVPPVVTPDEHTRITARKRTLAWPTRARLQTGPASIWTSATGRRRVPSAMPRCGSSRCRSARMRAVNRRRPRRGGRLLARPALRRVLPVRGSRQCVGVRTRTGRPRGRLDQERRLQGGAH